MGGAFDWLKAGLRTTKASPGNHYQEMMISEETSVVSPQKAEHTLDLPFFPCVERADGGTATFHSVLV